MSIKRNLTGNKPIGKGLEPIRLDGQESYNKGHRLTPRCVVAISDSMIDLRDPSNAFDYAQRFVPLGSKKQIVSKRLVFDSYGELSTTKTKDGTDFLLSVTTQKSIKDTAGTFDITLLGQGYGLSETLGYVNLASFIKPMDYVEIYFSGVDHSFELVMCGFVDRVTQKGDTSLGTGKPNHTITITGRDFGKFLINMKFPKFEGIIGAEHIRNIANTQVTAESSNCGGKGYLGALNHLIAAFVSLNFNSMKKMSEKYPTKKIKESIKKQLTEYFQTYKHIKDKDVLIDKYLQPYIYTFDINLPEKDTSKTSTIGELIGVIGVPPVSWEGPSCVLNSFGKQQQLWEAIKKFASEPFMEVFIDTTNRIIDLPLHPNFKHEGATPAVDSTGSKPTMRWDFDFWEFQLLELKKKKKDAGADKPTLYSPNISPFITIESSSIFTPKLEGAKDVMKLKVKDYQDETINPDFRIVPEKQKYISDKYVGESTKHTYSVKLENISSTDNTGYPGKKAFLIIRPRMWDSYIWWKKGTDKDKGNDFEAFYFSHMHPIGIDTQRIRAYSMTKSDEEVYSFYFVNPTNQVVTSQQLVALKYYGFDIQQMIKFGNTPLEVNVNFMPAAASAGTSTLRELTRRCIKNLGKWFNQNHIRWSGSLTLECSSHIRVGTKIFFVPPDHTYRVNRSVLDNKDTKKEGYFAYVEEVRNVWTYGRDLVTEIKFTHAESEIPIELPPLEPENIPPPQKEPKQPKPKEEQPPPGWVPPSGFRRYITPETTVGREGGDVPPVTPYPKYTPPPDREIPYEPEDSPEKPKPKKKIYTGKISGGAEVIEKEALGYFDEDVEIDTSNADAHGFDVTELPKYLIPQKTGYDCSRASAGMITGLINKKPIMTTDECTRTKYQVESIFDIVNEMASDKGVRGVKKFKEISRKDEKSMISDINSELDDGGVIALRTQTRKGSKSNHVTVITTSQNVRIRKSDGTSEEHTYLLTMDSWGAKHTVSGNKKGYGSNRYSEIENVSDINKQLGLQKHPAGMRWVRSDKVLQLMKERGKDGNSVSLKP